MRVCVCVSIQPFFVSARNIEKKKNNNNATDVSGVGTVSPFMPPLFWAGVFISYRQIRCRLLCACANDRKGASSCTSPDLFALLCICAILGKRYAWKSSTRKQFDAKYNHADSLPLTYCRYALANKIMPLPSWHRGV